MAGAAFLLSTVNQLSEGIAVLPAIAAVLAVALIVSAVLGLTRSGAERNGAPG